MAMASKSCKQNEKKNVYQVLHGVSCCTIILLYQVFHGVSCCTIILLYQVFRVCSSLSRPDETIAAVGLGRSSKAKLCTRRQDREHIEGAGGEVCMYVHLYVCVNRVSYRVHSVFVLDIFMLR